jgi:hypothetical protein
MICSRLRARDCHASGTTRPPRVLALRLPSYPPIPPLAKNGRNSLHTNAFRTSQVARPRRTVRAISFAGARASGSEIPCRTLADVVIFGMPNTVELPIEHSAEPTSYVVPRVVRSEVRNSCGAAVAVHKSLCFVGVRVRPAGLRDFRCLGQGWRYLSHGPTVSDG